VESFAKHASKLSTSLSLETRARCRRALPRPPPSFLVVHSIPVCDHHHAKDGGGKNNPRMHTFVSSFGISRSEKSKHRTQFTLPPFPICDTYLLLPIVHPLCGAGEREEGMHETSVSVPVLMDCSPPNSSKATDRQEADTLKHSKKCKRMRTP
jgi:hypothetical protein